MLEKELFNEFQEFSTRRLLNKYNVENKKTWEIFYFSSCGDEFFRNDKQLEKEIRFSNPNRYLKYKKSDSNVGDLDEVFFQEKTKLIITENIEYYKSPLNIYYDNVRENNELNIIHFGACRINEITFLFKKIELQEIFSTHKDFHTMLYTEQMLNYEVKYIWILFKWVRINKKLLN